CRTGTEPQCGEPLLPSLPLARCSPCRSSQASAWCDCPHAFPRSPAPGDRSPTDLWLLKRLLVLEDQCGRTRAYHASCMLHDCAGVGMLWWRQRNRDVTTCDRDERSDSERKARRRMPTVKLNDVHLYYELQGSADDMEHAGEKAVVLFLHGLGSS